MDALTTIMDALLDALSLYDCLPCLLDGAESPPSSHDIRWISEYRWLALSRSPLFLRIKHQEHYTAYNIHLDAYRVQQYVLYRHYDRY